MANYCKWPPTIMGMDIGCKDTTTPLHYKNSLQNSFESRLKERNSFEAVMMPTWRNYLYKCTVNQLSGPVLG